MQIAEPIKLTKANSFRFPELDCLRGICVIVVLLYHYTFAFDFHYKILSEEKFYLHHGNLAVHMFFVISGFVIFLTLERSKSGWDFIVSRFSRLYPAYWAGMFLTILFLLIFPVPTLGHFSIKQILINITMLQGFTKIPLIDQVYWTLKFELTFYAIMYLLYMTKVLGKITIISYLWLALSVASCFFAIVLKKYLDVLLILEYMPLFIAGIMFYKLKKGQENVFYHLLIVLTFIVECFWLMKHPDEDVLSLIILGVIYLLFYVFAYRGLDILVNRFLLFLGSISYTLYLIHNVIGYSIIYRVRSYTDLQIIYVVIPAVITIGLATIITTYIEKPALKLIRNKYKSLTKDSKPSNQ